MDQGQNMITRLEKFEKVLCSNLRIHYHCGLKGPTQGFFYTTKFREDAIISVCSISSYHGQTISTF